MEMKKDVLYSVSGTDIEKMERIKSDRLLLNTIESERVERMEATKETFDELGELAMNDVVIWKQLRKYETTLKVVVVAETIFIIAMMLLNW